MPAHEPYAGLENLDAMTAAQNYNDAIVRLILKHRPQGSRSAVLDFGAGIGTFPDLLAREGVRVDCLEPDHRMSEVLRSKGYSTASAAEDIPDGFYDYAYSLNVLEHIENDAEALAAISGKLRQGGRILLYVPAFQLLYSAMDVKVGHYRRYTCSGLEKLAAEAGLRPLEVGYVDAMGFFASLAYKVFGGQSGEISEAQVTFFDKRVFPLNALLDPFLGRVLGKNAYCVCNRP